MLDDGLLMLFIMNPFAQMLFLSKLIHETGTAQFARIYLEGTLLTFGICVMCAFVGEFVIFRMFHVTLPAMRVFGGLVNLQLSYTYVMKGPEGIKLFRGDVSSLAQQIALPIMVGAGVVWVSMRIGRMHPPSTAAAIIGSVLAVNFVAVLAYQALLRRARGRFQLLVTKYFGVAMRFNALMIGALSIEMILGGIREFMTSQPAS